MRLDELAEQEGDAVAIDWKSFLLRPQPERRSLAEFTEYTKSWGRPSGLEPKADFQSPWTGASPPPSHSLPAAIAGKTAATFGQEIWGRYHNKLLRAYFAENRDVSSSDVLLQLAHEIDIDTDLFEEIRTASEEDFKQQVFAEHNEALTSGISGVPAVVIDNRFLISGAVEVQQYRKALAHYRDLRERENNE